MWPRSVLGGPGKVETPGCGPAGMLCVKSFVWREWEILGSYLFVNPHVLLALSEFRFVLGDPHFHFLPGLRGELSCSH